MDLFAEYECRVDTYHLVDVVVFGDKLVPALVPSGNEPARTYRPLTPGYATLWQTFGIYDPSPAQCLALASEYGLLGEPESLPRADAPESSVFGEDILTWQMRLAELAHAGAIYEHIALGNHAAFRPLFEWKRDRVYRRYITRNELGADIQRGVDRVWDEELDGPDRDDAGTFKIELMEFAGPAVTSRWKRGDLLKPAELLLHQMVTEQLHEGVSASVALDRRDLHPRLSVGPRNLRAALWLQLALAITSGARIVACRDCHKPFEISRSPLGLRGDAEFCSDACKSRDYRRRKSQARHLSQAGSRVANIAIATNTDVETVRAWIGKKSDARSPVSRGRSRKRISHE